MPQRADAIVDRFVPMIETTSTVQSFVIRSPASEVSVFFVLIVVLESFHRTVTSYRSGRGPSSGATQLMYSPLVGPQAEPTAFGSSGAGPFCGCGARDGLVVGAVVGRAVAGEVAVGVLGSAVGCTGVSLVASSGAVVGESPGAGTSVPVGVLGAATGGACVSPEREAENA